jgi:hypothetical protein
MTRSLGREFVFGGRGLQLLQRQFELIQQPRGALRARAITVAIEFLDLQLQVGNQRLVVGGFGSRHREFRFGMDGSRRFGDKLVLRNEQRRLQRVDVICSAVTSRIHAPDRITNRGG